MKNWKREKYNGWDNWYSWNIALWLDNTSPIYFQAVELMQDYQTKRKNKAETIKGLYFIMRCHFGAKTPDGARITKTAINEWFKSSKDTQW